MRSVSVIIASRLAVNPMSESGRLYLHRAIGSVRRQTVCADAEVIVGLSPGDDGRSIDLAMQAGADGVGRAPVAGQAAAINAAVASALINHGTDVLAFLEDDDHWSDKRLEYGLAALEAGYDFVSSNQREVTVDGSYVRVNDFATMSGYLMTRKTWDAVGPMDESFKWHLDNEWLGRLNTAKMEEIVDYHGTDNEALSYRSLKRLHLVEAGADREPRRPWLRNVMQFSKAATTEEREPLVTRTVNPEGGMSRIATDPVARKESEREHGMLWEMFSCIPW